MHLLLLEWLLFSTVYYVAHVLAGSGNDRFITPADDTFMFMPLGRLMAFSMQNDKGKPLHKCVMVLLCSLLALDHAHCRKSVNKAAIIIQSKKPDLYVPLLVVSVACMVHYLI